MEEMRRLREERDWTQAKLARAAGMDPASLNQIETGKRSPRVETLEKIAGALEVEVGDFFPKGESSLQREIEQEQRRLRYLDFWSEFMDETAGDIEEWRDSELGDRGDPTELPEKEFVLFVGGVARHAEIYNRVQEMMEGEIGDAFRSEPETETVKATVNRCERAWRRLRRVTISLLTPGLEERIGQVAGAEQAGVMGQMRDELQEMRERKTA